MPLNIYSNKNQPKRIEGEECFEVSVYKIGVLTAQGVENISGKIQVAFPKLFKDKKPKEITDFILLLTERLRANGFTDERFRDAVNHVIDNFASWNKEPSIADFISYDKKIKLYSLYDLKKKYKDSYYFGATEDPISKYYIRVEVGTSYPIYATKFEAERYGLKLWVKPEENEKTPEHAKNNVVAEIFNMVSKEVYSEPEKKKTFTEKEKKERSEKFKQILDEEKLNN